MIKKICQFCKKDFVLKTHANPNQKYCSKLCRERSWRKKNKKHEKIYKHDYWIQKKRKNPLVCNECEKFIPEDERRGGIRYCSKCSIIVRKRREREFRRRTFHGFDEYKKSIGCKICRYNKLGCCLDFHHVKPKEKERRITAKMWKSNSDLIRKELKKCIVVCKNCHYEIHYKMRNENGDAD